MGECLGLVLRTTSNCSTYVFGLVSFLSSRGFSFLSSFFFSPLFSDIYLLFTCKNRPTELFRCAKYLEVTMIQSGLKIILVLTTIFTTAHFRFCKPQRCQQENLPLTCNTFLDFPSLLLNSRK